MFADTPPDLAQDLFRRWAKIQSGIRWLDARALLLVTPVNLYYTTGKIFSGCVWLPLSGTPRIFVRRPQTLTGANVHPIRNYEEVPRILTELGESIGRLALESEELIYGTIMRLANLREKKPPVENAPPAPDAAPAGEAAPPAEPARKRPPIDGSGLLRKSRCAKTPYELALMREGGARHAAVVAEFPKLFTPGMTDHAFALECEAAVRRAGSLGLFRIFGAGMEAFMGTVLAGDNACAPSPYDFALGGAGLDPSLPVGQSGVELKPGMTVLADIAYNHRGYLTDCSRAYSIGNPTLDTLRAHQCCVDILNTVAEYARPGAYCAELHQMALDMAMASGYADNFMGLSQKAQFVGHGTGLYINEWPVIGVKSLSSLEAGNVIALEPKIVLPGVGAVGVEDTFIITKNGAENITPCRQDLVVL